MRSYLTVCAFAIAASVQAAPIDAGVLEDLTAGLQGVMPGQGNKQPVDNNALTTGQNSGTNGEGIINDVLKSTSFRTIPNLPTLPGAGGENMPTLPLPNLPGAGGENMPTLPLPNLPGAGGENMPTLPLPNLPGAGGETIPTPIGGGVTTPIGGGVTTPIGGGVTTPATPGTPAPADPYVAKVPYTFVV
ncbi:hypothetical protein Alg130_01199 [Pyrenophora tritici-repentis]|nr:hypothetical protein Alg130_01199 [Pyrenophora tritici-repentis]